MGSASRSRWRVGHEFVPRPARRMARSAQARHLPGMPRARDPRFTADLAAFARSLRRLREERGLSQRDLALRAGISVTMVQNLERPADGGNARFTTLLALAQALQVTPGALVDPQSGQDPAGVPEP